jgi:hypothetical protein
MVGSGGEVNLTGPTEWSAADVIPVRGFPDSDVI